VPWAFMLVIRTVLILIGWILIPIAAYKKAYVVNVKSIGPVNETGTVVYKAHFTWKLMHLWDNYEDGIANDTYVKFNSMFMRIVYWSAFRNPVNNLRITPILSVMISKDKVFYIGSLPGDQIRSYDTKIPQWFFAWQGMYSNFYWQFNLFGELRRFWIGWKIYPTDIFGVTEYRKRGAGFALQFKRVKI
jgi:hypothetical protein